MGWSSGSRLFREIINAIRPVVEDEATRQIIYADLIEAFEEHDWDSQEECLGEDPAYDAALAEVQMIKRLKG